MKRRTLKCLIYWKICLKAGELRKSPDVAGDVFGKTKEVAGNAFETAKDVAGDVFDKAKELLVAQLKTRRKM